MNPEDRASWLLREQYPTGTARGWRRTGCLVLLIGALVLLVLTLVLVAVA